MNTVNVTIRFGGGNSVTRAYPVGTTVSQIIGESRNQVALGYGANVQASIARMHIDGNYPVGRDVVIDLETRANQKAADITVTVTFGGGNSTTQTVPRGTTVGQLIENRRVQSALGVGTNVQANIDRVPQTNDTQLEDGDVVNLETIANQKAA